MTRRLGEMWDQFLRQVLIPAGAGEVQIEETRRAFYQGAGALFFILNGDMSEGGEVTQRDLALVQDVHDEIEEFTRELGRPKRRRGGVS
jgi:hypothetical protein